jgi:hypothetical protein
MTPGLKYSNSGYNVVPSEPYTLFPVYLTPSILPPLVCKLHLYPVFVLITPVFLTASESLSVTDEIKINEIGSTLTPLSDKSKSTLDIPISHKS